MTTLITGLDQWNDTLTNSFCPMSCVSLSDENPAKFSGSLASKSLNRARLAQVSSPPVLVSRTKQNIAQVSDAYYMVKFQIKGHCTVTQQGQEANLNPGDFVICSSSEPYNLHFPSDYYQAVFSIPQDTFQEMFQSPDDYLGKRMGNEFPTHGILSQFVYSLIQRMDMLEPATLQSMETNLLDLLITSLKAEQGTVDQKADNKAPEQHLLRIKRFIGMHIKDYRLSVDFIAQSENISKRYLHMLFKKRGISVSRYIQQLRLEGCHKDLTNPELQHLSTTDMAFEWGFGDVSHFHRCFKAQYQITPRQLRIQTV